ncbi:hypothetical protein D3C76_1063730 [compost metagenome]
MSRASRVFLRNISSGAMLSRSASAWPMARSCLSSVEASIGNGSGNAGGHSAGAMLPACLISPRRNSPSWRTVRGCISSIFARADRLSGCVLASGHSECSRITRLRGKSRARASRSRQAQSSRKTASCARDSFQASLASRYSSLGSTSRRSCATSSAPSSRTQAYFSSDNCGRSFS